MDNRVIGGKIDAYNLKEELGTGIIDVNNMNEELGTGLINGNDLNEELGTNIIEVNKNISGIKRTQSYSQMPLKVKVPRLSNSYKSGLEYPDDVTRVVNELKKTHPILIGETFDVITLLKSEKDDLNYLQRIGGDQVVEVREETFQGKYIMVCCFHVPVFREGLDSCQLQPLVNTCSELYSTRHDFEMVLVAKMNKMAEFEEAVFDHFISGFSPSCPCLVVPFSDSKRRDFICKYLDFDGPPMCLILDDNRSVLVYEPPAFLSRYGADAFPFTPEHLQKFLDKDFQLLEGPSTSNLVQLLQCNPSDVVARFNSAGVREMKTISELSTKKVEDDLVGSAKPWLVCPFDFDHSASMACNVLVQSGGNEQQSGEQQSGKGETNTTKSPSYLETLKSAAGPSQPPARQPPKFTTLLLPQPQPPPNFDPNKAKYILVLMLPKSLKVLNEKEENMKMWKKYEENHDLNKWIVHGLRRVDEKKLRQTATPSSEGFTTDVYESAAGLEFQRCSPNLTFGDEDHMEHQWTKHGVWTEFGLSNFVHNICVLAKRYDMNNILPNIAFGGGHRTRLYDQAWTVAPICNVYRQLTQKLGYSPRLAMREKRNTHEWFFTEIWLYLNGQLDLVNAPRITYPQKQLDWQVGQFEPSQKANF